MLSNCAKSHVCKLVILRVSVRLDNKNWKALCSIARNESEIEYLMSADDCLVILLVQSVYIVEKNRRYFLLIVKAYGGCIYLSWELYATTCKQRQLVSSVLQPSIITYLMHNLVTAIANKCNGCIHWTTLICTITLNIWLSIYHALRYGMVIKLGVSMSVHTYVSIYIHVPLVVYTWVFPVK